MQDENMKKKNQNNEGANSNSSHTRHYMELYSTKTMKFIYLNAKKCKLNKTDKVTVSNIFHNYNFFRQNMQINRLIAMTRLNLGYFQTKSNLSNGQNKQQITDRQIILAFYLLYY